MPKPPRLARCNSRRASRLRAGYRVELLARHGLSALPTSAEVYLAAAGNAAVEGDAARVARALDSADRSAGAAARAVRGRPRAVPGVLRPATAPRYFPPAKSGGGFNPENPSGVAERLRAAAAARDGEQPPPAESTPDPDPVRARIAELERQIAAPPAGRGWKVGGA